MQPTLLYLLANGDGRACGKQLARPVKSLDREKYRIALLSASLSGQEFLYFRTGACRPLMNPYVRRQARPMPARLPGLSDLLGKLETAVAPGCSCKALLLSFLRRGGAGCLYLPPLSRADTPLHFSPEAWTCFFKLLTQDNDHPDYPAGPDGPDHSADRLVFLLHIDRIYADVLLDKLPDEASPLIS